jgi:MipA family protein
MMPILRDCFAGYRTGHWEALVTVRQAITHSGNGMEGLAEIDYRVSLVAHKVMLTLGPEVSFADTRYNSTWFGVSVSQSTSSGLPVFTPGSGLDTVGAHAGLAAALAPHTLLRAFATFNHLTDEVADSPIVQRRNEAVVGTGLAYLF